MPPGMGVVDPVGIEIALGDFDAASKRWVSLIGQPPAVRDVTADGRRRFRFPSAGVASFDLVEAGGPTRAGDCKLVLRAPDVDARVTAIRELGVSVTVDAKTGDARIAAEHANGVEVSLTATRPPAPPGPPLVALPYVFDIAVAEMASAIPVWDAILGIEGVVTPEEADASGQLEMHHYVVDGETHAIGLMKLKTGMSTTRQTPGSSIEYILSTHGDGLLCVGFLYKTDLDEHIAGLDDEARSLLLHPKPQSYMMGRNNTTHPDATGGVSVIIAQHFEGWEGDLQAAVEGTWRPDDAS